MKTVQFPVTDECREVVERKFHKMFDGMDEFEFKYVPFDFKLDSHREIGGYIELSSSLDKSKKSMEGYFNNALFSCHHTSEMTLPIPNFSQIMQLKRIESGYAKIHGENVTVYFGSRTNANNQRNADGANAPPPVR